MGRRPKTKIEKIIQNIGEKNFPNFLLCRVRYDTKCSDCNSVDINRNEDYNILVVHPMLSILLAFTLAHHNDSSPYGWHMSCERYLQQRIEILMDDNLDTRSKYNLIGYLRSKVKGECNEMLV
jgi:hypothetical protein